MYMPHDSIAVDVPIGKLIAAKLNYSPYRVSHSLLLHCYKSLSLRLSCSPPQRLASDSRSCKIDIEGHILWERHALAERPIHIMTHRSKTEPALLSSTKQCTHCVSQNETVFQVSSGNHMQHTCEASTWHDLDMPITACLAPLSNHTEQSHCCCRGKRARRH